ncbi:MAG: glycosyltransferase [Cyanobacteria bacterium P01_B01_bin.77]
MQTSSLLPVPTSQLIIPEEPPAAVATSDTAYKPWFSLIVPTFQEADNVQNVVRILSGLLDEATGGEYELIIVDDNSPDGTWEKALTLMSDYPNLRVMRRVKERGLSTAVIRGWQAARGSVLGVIDGDLQHPPETLLKMLDQMRQGSDLVVASRHVEDGGVSNWSFSRRILSRGAQLLGLMICPNVVGMVSDPMSGYFIVRRSAIANAFLDPRGYKILLEVIGRGQVYDVAEVGYVFKERLAGESKVTYQQYVDYIIHLAKLRSRGRVGYLRRKLQLPISRLIRFGTVGLSGVFVDMAVLFLLSDPTMVGWNLTRSKILAAETAIINNFIWNDLWTFGDISKKQRGLKPALRRFLKFNLVCLIGLTINVLLLNLLFNVFGINRYFANFIAIALVTLWNFWINLKLSWRATNTK